MNNYVLTADGYKSTDTLTPKDFTFTKNGKHSRIIYVKQSETSNRAAFLNIETAIDDIPSLLRKDTLVLSVDDVFQRRFIEAGNIVEDSWVFVPWIQQEKTNPKLTIDLSKFVDNYHDSLSLFLFNNEILEIADKLNIPFKAVKELLIREAAEYDEHLIALKRYIFDTYDIIESSTDPETSFLKFKKYVLQNHIFKMNRYLSIDENFISFAVASLTRASTVQTSYNRNNRYLITYTFNTGEHRLLNGLTAFLKSINVKFEVSEDKRKVEVKNKPLYKYVTDGLQKDINFIFRLPDHLAQQFVTELFMYEDTVCNISKEVALQIKQLFLYYKKVVGVSSSPLGNFQAKVYQDDLSVLNSTVILDVDGYYTRVTSVYPVNTRNAQTVPFANSEDSELILLNCVIKN